MKYHISILALGIALLPLVRVRADEKTRFMQSLAIPLSHAETRQLSRLFNAQDTAGADEKDVSDRWSAANKAADAASPANRVALQKKADAVFALEDAAVERWGVANTALEKFKASKRARLPREVRSRLPKGATTLYAGRSPMGSGGKPMIVHLWTSARKAPPGSNYAFEESPFYLDVFGNKAGHWLPVARTEYKGENFPDPDQISMRWLYTTKKQGPVLVMVSPVYMSTLYTVVTYPEGIGLGKNTPSYVQEFSQGGVGGGKTVYDFGVDGRGMMTVLEKSWYLSSPITTLPLSWNGHEYARPAAK